MYLYLYSFLYFYDMYMYLYDAHCSWLDYDHDMGWAARLRTMQWETIGWGMMGRPAVGSVFVFYQFLFIFLFLFACVFVFVWGQCK